jgi:predicted MFS family arabinose efflux permease
MSAVRAVPTTEPGVGRGSQRAALPVLVGVTGLVAVVSSLGAPLIPSIAQSYHVSLSAAEWVLTATLMTGALATPAMGRLADGPFKRRVVEVALGAVLVGCVISAVSTGFAVLVIGRGLQGFGLGLLPVTMAMARSQFSPQKAGRAIATLSVSVAIGAGLGYPITTLVAQFFGFRAAFWFGAITVAVALLLVVLVLPSRSDGRSRRFDYPGMVTLGAAVVGVSVLLSEGGSWGWTSLRSLGLVAFCLIMMGLWIARELRISDPLIDVRQVRNRSVLTADASGFLIAIAMYMFLPIIIEFVQVPVASGYGFGTSIVVSGLVFVPLSVGTFLASRCLPAYMRRFGMRSMIPVGSVVFAVTMLFFATEHRALWEAFVVAGFGGIGIGFTFAAMPGFIVQAVPASETGSAMGLYQVLRSIGLSLGSALAAAVLLAYTTHGHIYPTYQGFRVTLLIASALCMTTAVLSFLLPGRISGRPSAPTKEVEKLMEEEAEVEGVGLMLADERLLTESGE